MKRKIIIIGGVALGASAAARLRRLNENDEIIMFERDEYISFANCGLPYYIGDVITERDNLIVQTKEGMAARFNLDVRNFSEVTKINRDTKTVTVLNKQTNETYEESYDIAILAPGASPIVPPIPGIELAKNVFKLRNIPDTDAVKSYINTHNVKRAVVVGAGFIGIEMAENLNHIGIDVTVLDLAPQVMTLFDQEMSKMIQNTMVYKGVNFKLETSIASFEDQGNRLVLTDGTTLDTDMVIMAIGVLPETKLAVEAGLEIGETRAIVINEYMQTSDPSIYAGGDAVEVKNFITKKATKVPLAWPANRQGRLVADHINGIATAYNGTLGSAVIKIFDNVAATTGLNERAALASYDNVGTLHIHRGNHAGYYPNSTNITLKLIFDKTSRRVLGAQAYGQEGTEKRIDVIATAIKFNATVEQLSDLELTYAPPFSSAKDPVNIAGYVAQNILDERYIPFYTTQIADLIKSDAQIVDVRTKDEFELGTIGSAINVDVDMLRNNVDKIDFSKDVYIFCQVGLRGFIAAQILRQHGYKKDIYNLSGGYKLFADTKDVSPRSSSKEIDLTHNTSDTQQDTTHQTREVVEIDACGLQCPGPILKLKKTVDALQENQVVHIQASDIGFFEDVKTWTKSTGNQLIDLKIENAKVMATIKKGAPQVASAAMEKNGQTIVVFSNDFDKLMASFIIANGALAMNADVTLFFTFWGLSALRKENYKAKNKSFMETMFGIMLPKGSKKTNLSQMKMLGNGGRLMRYIMKQKNVDSLESLIQEFLASGGKIVACTMSMDVMGIKQEELIDGIEYGGVATYIGDAKNAYNNLFI